MNLSVRKLDEIRADIGEDDLNNLLSTFKCSAEPAAERFLKKTAIKHDRESISRTYLAVGEDESGLDTIKGFFTLAIKCISVEEYDPIPKDILEQMNVNNKIAQAYLLGQLAKADGVEKGFGREMIKRAFHYFAKGNEMFGCRVARLDCRDSLIDYYESCGFTFIRKNFDKELNQMVAII
ncbi:hypothetical protein Mpt1_c05500 [Candidatus Methanoplasma termitum]|uniref:N-acetyltransferase domain-containing protein n=1 Tax=Candidatus Methanoplasma termitum TaxID=1577791 RepID=A0A0A7LBA5_9ARCH|nr:N-acetyltransferase [Candidatus Methanoplasma termitum]AIZ56440.1 hypothetical protein Mpt1_c05500 [Candidatus Methanoplasma termitum]